MHQISIFWNVFVAWYSKKAGVCSTSPSGMVARDGGADGTNDEILHNWALPERLLVGIALHV